MKYATALLIMCLFTSCIKDDIESNNTAIFDAIWQEMDAKYGGFGVRDINWEESYQIYSPRVSDDLSNIELFKVCTEMLDVFDDQHIFLSTEEGQSGLGFSSGKDGDETLAEKEFSLKNVIDNYLEPGFFNDNFGDEEDVEIQFVYGRISGENIGYIYFPHFEPSSNDWHKQIDDALVELIDTEGIILDVRNNSGGFPVVDRYVAKRFMKEEFHTFSIQTRNGPLHTDFDEPTKYFSTPSENAYTKPIISLINKSTVSAGEEFMLYLESQEHVTVLGSRTSNAFSGVSFERFLPNGWRFGMPVQLYTYPDGSSPEGVGIIPDIEMKNDSIDVINGIDRILEEAIMRL